MCFVGILESLFDKVTFKQTPAGSEGVLHEGRLRGSIRGRANSKYKSCEAAKCWGIEME